eukprot:31205-Pelagococcus_subviridis.AAC.10
MHASAAHSSFNVVASHSAESGYGEYTLVAPTHVPSLMYPSAMHCFGVTCSRYPICRRMIALEASPLAAAAGNIVSHMSNPWDSALSQSMDDGTLFSLDCEMTTREPVHMSTNTTPTHAHRGRLRAASDDQSVVFVPVLLRAEEPRERVPGAVLPNRLLHRLLGFERHERHRVMRYRFLFFRHALRVFRNLRLEPRDVSLHILHRTHGPVRDAAFVPPPQANEHAGSVLLRLFPIEPFFFHRAKFLEPALRLRRVPRELRVERLHPSD